jgi:hypothetical protein
MKRRVDPTEEARLAKLQAFAHSLCDKRKEAVDGVANSGAPRIWEEDEEYYDSVDEVNRAEITFEKGATPGAPLEAYRTPKSTKSTVFVNIVQTYVDMAAAAIADMLLPTDDMPFGVKPTPEPDLLEAKKDTSAIAEVPGPNGERVQMNAAQLAEMILSEARDCAKKVETWIWDKLTESHWHAEVRKLIDESAKIGTSILKGPVPIEKRYKKIDKKPGTNMVAIVMGSKLEPASKQISPKNFFPDPACGENIQHGSYTWERDTISAKTLREMKTQLDQDGEPFYIGSQIDLVLAEGPRRSYLTGAAQAESKRSKTLNPADRFEIWYFYGLADADDLAAAGCKCEPGAAIPVMVTMVNDCVIKASLSTLDSGEFPYDVLRWQRIPGKWYGKGETRKLRTMQRILNASVRAMMDNAGLSSGPQIVIDGDVIEPADGTGNYELTPRKVWRKIMGAEVPGDGNIKNAIASINIESLQQELMAIVRFAIEMADKIATMPIQQQGQQGVTQETAEGRRLLQNNAGVVKRRMAKIFDDDITEPHVERYHEWMLLYHDDPAMKKDVVIDAVGSSALFERDAENMAIAGLAQLTKDPAFGISPSKWVVEYLKSNKIDPKRLEYTEEEKKELQSQPPPKDPRIEAAEIAAKAKVEVAARDTDRDTKYNESLTRRDAAAHEAKMAELAQRERLAMLDYANKRGITLDRVKAELAKTAMTLRSQEKLAQTPPKGAPQVAKPVAEPQGRAPKGEAFQK